MIEGIYTFRDNGKIVAQSKNLVTTLGKNVILNYMAGYTSQIAGSIAVGTGTTAASLTDTMLGFEFARTNVTLTAADYATTGIVFKGILPASVAGTVYEAGIWSNVFTGTQTSGVNGSRMLAQFDSVTEAGWTGGTFNVDATKIGGDSLRVSAALSTTTTATLTGNAYDLSAYTSADKILFAYNCNDANNNNIKLRFKTDVSNYFETNITTANGSGYHIVSLLKSNFTATGTPSWGNITTLEIASTAKSSGTSVVDFDGLRVESVATTPDVVLVSRSVLATPLPKTNVRPMELEYRLRVTV